MDLIQIRGWDMTNISSNVGGTGRAGNQISEQEKSDTEKIKDNDNSVASASIKVVEPKLNLQTISPASNKKNQADVNLADRSVTVLGSSPQSPAEALQLFPALSQVAQAPTIDEAVAVSSYKKLKEECAVKKEALNVILDRFKLDMLHDITNSLGHPKKEVNIAPSLKSWLDNIEMYHEDFPDATNQFASDLKKFSASLPNNPASEKLVSDTVKQLENECPVLCDSLTSFCRNLAELWEKRDDPDVFMHLTAMLKEHNVDVDSISEKKNIREALKEIEWGFLSKITSADKRLNDGGALGNRQANIINGGMGSVELIMGNEYELLSGNEKNTLEQSNTKVPQLHRQYALKSQPWPSDPNDQAQCLDEIKHASSAKGSVRLYEHKVKDDVLYMLMDCGGVSIAGLINQESTSNDKESPHSPLTPELVKTLLHPVAKQLQALHSQNVLHRDIKPPNILLDPASGETTLIDFGQSIEKEHHDHTLTGTPGYLAPELKYNLDAYSDKTDAFSFGLVCAELLIGVHPPLTRIDGIGFFVNDVPKAINETRQLVADCCGTGSDAFDLVDKLLAEDPEKRCSITEALAHPFFSGTTQKTYSYMELDQKLRDKFEALKTQRNNDLEALAKQQPVKKAKLTNDKEELLIRDIKQIKSALQWHDLESNKKTLEKKLEREPDKNTQSLQDMIASLSSDQVDLEEQAGDWLSTRPA